MKTNDHDHRQLRDSVGACRLVFTEMSRSKGLEPHVRELMNRGEELITRLVTSLESIRASQVKRIDELETLRFKYEERIDELQARVMDLEESL